VVGVIWYNRNVNLNNFALDISDAIAQVYSIILRKPFLTVKKVKYTPQRDRSGEVTRELISFTVVNESCHDIDVQRIWFLTSFNRQIFSDSIDAKMPVKMPENDRATYFVPVEELKAALNKIVGETITKVVAFDKAGHPNTGRVDQVAQEVFAK